VKETFSFLCQKQNLCNPVAPLENQEACKTEVVNPIHHHDLTINNIVLYIVMTIETEHNPSAKRRRRRRREGAIGRLIQQKIKRVAETII
jgi:hypothetical protein